MELNITGPEINKELAKLYFNDGYIENKYNETVLFKVAVMIKNFDISEHAIIEFEEKTTDDAKEIIIDLHEKGLL